MKQLNLMKALFCLLGCAAVLTSCKDDDQAVQTPAIEVAATRVDVPAEGGPAQVGYQLLNVGDASGLTVRSDAAWVHDFDLSQARILSFQVDDNPLTDIRQTKIWLEYPGAEPAAVSIRQQGFEIPDFEIVVKEQTGGSVVFEIYPLSSSKPYFASVVPKASMDMYPDDDDYFQADLEYFKAVAQASEMTLDQYLMASTFKGAQRLTYNGLTQKEDYVIYAYGLTLLGERTTPIIRLPLSIPPVVSETRLSYKMTVTTTKINLDITATNNDPYIWSIEPAEYFRGQTDEEMMTTVSEIYGEYMDMIAETGSTTVSYDIDAGEEYVVLLFGWQYGSWTTGLQKEFVQIPAGGNPADCRFTFSVADIHPYDATVSIVASDNTVYYYWDVFEASASEQQIMTYIQNDIDNYIRNTGTNAAAFWQRYAVRGTTTMARSGLYSNTEYKTVAFAVNTKTGDIAGDFYYGEPFRTAESVKADISIEVGYDKYYDGTALAEAMPEKYGDCVNMAYVPLTTAITGQAEHYYYAVMQYETGFDDPAVVPDDMIMYALRSSGVADQPNKNFILDFNMDMIIFAIAEDAAGNFSPVYRHRIHLTKSGVSPIDDLISGAALSASAATRSSLTVRKTDPARKPSQIAQTKPERTEAATIERERLRREPAAAKAGVTARRGVLCK